MKVNALVQTPQQQSQEATYKKISLLAYAPNKNYFLVQSQLDMTCAVMKKVKFGSEDLEREATVLKNLSHHHICKFKAFRKSIQNEEKCLVMEYFEGGTLLQAMSKQRSIYSPENEILSRFSQIVDSVAYLHSQGFVHRNI